MANFIAAVAAFAGVVTVAADLATRGVFHQALGIVLFACCVAVLGIAWSYR